MAAESKPKSRETWNAAADDGRPDAYRGATTVREGQKAVLKAWLAQVSRKDPHETGAKRKRRHATAT